MDGQARALEKIFEETAEASVLSLARRHLSQKEIHAALDIAVDRLPLAQRTYILSQAHNLMASCKGMSRGPALELLFGLGAFINRDAPPALVDEADVILEGSEDGRERYITK